MKKVTEKQYENALKVIERYEIQESQDDPFNLASIVSGDDQKLIYLGDNATRVTFGKVYETLPFKSRYGREIYDRLIQVRDDKGRLRVIRKGKYGNNSVWARAKLDNAPDFGSGNFVGSSPTESATVL